MPRIEDLTQFSRKLMYLGNEPVILSERGLSAVPTEPPTPEEREAILARNTLRVRKAPSETPKPKAAPPSSMDALLSSAFGGSEAGDDDFSDLFGASEPSDSAGAEDSGFDFSIFGDTDEEAEETEEETPDDAPEETPEEIEESAEPAPAPPRVPPPEVFEEAAADAPSGEEPESAPEELFEGLFGADDQVPAEIEVEPPTPEEESLLDDFLADFGKQQESVDDEPSPREAEAESTAPKSEAEPDSEADSVPVPEGESEEETEPEAVEGFAGADEMLAGLFSDEGVEVPAADEPGTESSFDLEALEAGEPGVSGAEDFDLDAFGPGDDAGDFDLGAEFGEPAESPEAGESIGESIEIESGAEPGEAPDSDDIDEFGELGSIPGFGELTEAEEPSAESSPTDFDFGEFEPDEERAGGAEAAQEPSETEPIDFGGEFGADFDSGFDAGTDAGDEVPEFETDAEAFGELPSEPEELAPEADGVEPDFGDFADFPSEPEELSAEAGGVEPDLGDFGDFGPADFEAAGTELPDEFGTAGGEPDGLPPDFAAEFGGDEEFSDEFSMGDFGAEFGILDESIDEVSGTAVESAPGPAGESESEELLEIEPDQAVIRSLSDEEFRHLQESLDYLPLNVRLAVAEAVSSTVYPPDQIKILVDDLVLRETPKKIAADVSRITGKRVQVPKGYERRSGLAFAEEQKSFLYQFREKIWPITRLVLLIGAAAGLLVYFSYSYVYKPLYARSLYREGLASIAEEQYPRANTLFDRAYQVWPAEGRFFDFAQAFAAKRQYSLAQEKYEELLAIDPIDRRGVLEYADFAAYTLRDYRTAVDTLNRLLDRTKSDYEPLLAQGDIYMEWARYTADPETRTQYYDAARSAYVLLSAVHGQTDPILFRLLLYFARTGDLARAFRLQQVFEADPKAQIEPRIYAELAGFYIDTWRSGQTSPIVPSEDGVSSAPTGFAPDLLEEAQKLLFVSLDADPMIPEVHYQLARSFTEQLQYSQELLALNSARTLFEEIRAERPLSQFELAQEIDTLIRLGESSRRSGNLMSAERWYRNAVDLYQQARDNLQVQPEHTFGRVFANLGDLYYYEGNDYPAALRFYLDALANGYGDGNLPSLPGLVRDIQYKIAFVHYGEGTRAGYEAALGRLFEAEGPTPTVNTNLMFAKANTLYQLGNYSAAAALYQRLINRLVEERERIATFLVEEDTAHRGLVDFLIRSYNNLGVTMYQLSRSVGVDRTRRQVEAQFYLSKATELAENVARDSETFVRAETRSLPFLNLRSILVPDFAGDVLIDPDIPKDLTAVAF